MSYTNAPIEAFRAGTVAESPALSRDLETAVGLLRGFVEGAIAPSEVFDVGQLGQFLAACELWSARHALYWNNLRFYLDPVSLRLAPVAYDASVANRPDTTEIIARQEPFVARLLDDPAVHAAYEKGLRDLANDLLGGGLRGGDVRVYASAQAPAGDAGRLGRYQQYLYRCLGLRPIRPCHSWCRATRRFGGKHAEGPWRIPWFGRCARTTAPCG